MIIAPEMAIATFKATKVTFKNLSSISCVLRFRGSGRFVGISAALSKLEPDRSIAGAFGPDRL
jgi:hypothetical protein